MRIEVYMEGEDDSRMTLDWPHVPREGEGMVIEGKVFRVYMVIWGQHVHQDGTPIPDNPWAAIYLKPLPEPSLAERMKDYES